VDLLVDMAEDRGFATIWPWSRSLKPARAPGRPRTGTQPQSAFRPSSRPRHKPCEERSPVSVGHMRKQSAAVGTLSGVRRECFMKTLIKNAGLIRNFEIIGEAANRLSAPAREGSKEAWRKVIAFRNRLIHATGAIGSRAGLGRHPE